MKLAFSTLGCPDWDLDTIISRAKEYGFDGIEFRGVKDELDVSKLSDFRQNAGETKGKLQDAGVSVACFSSSVFMSNINEKNEADSLDEIRRYAELCEKFSAPNIRVFGGSIGLISWDEAIEKAAEILQKMDEIVRDTNIKIVIETHDDWMQSIYFKKLMEKGNFKRIGILWDVNHPYMFVGEPPEVTYRLLGKWIYHTHWKDTYMEPETEHGFLPCLMGEGDVPHERIYRQLKEGGFDGYFSLEWEKRWHPEIPGPEIAFPNYVEFMRNLEKEG